MFFKKKSYLFSLLPLATVAILSSPASLSDPFSIKNPRFSISEATDTTGRARATKAQRAKAKSPMPLLKPHQLPTDVRRLLGMNESGVTSSANSVDGQPYTTKRAVPNTEALTVMQQQPFASAGKLWMQRDDGLFVCSASIIDKGLIVTAAHCLVEFGTGRTPNSVWFEPGRHGDDTPFGSFNVTQWIYTTSYADGTDVCDPQAPGIVCENDLAIGVVEPNASGKYVKNVVRGKFGVQDKGFSYASFGGETTALITQLGYPCSLDNCLKLIRTDSAGVQSTYNQVIIGTDQTGGSSGGPWLVNFGFSPERDASNPIPADSNSNKVVAVTSWGYVDLTLDIQGASRFDNNSEFPAPGPSNIEAMKKYACASYPSHCK